MAGYIGSKASVVSSGAERKTTVTATSGQTSLTGLSYTPNHVHVFQNGVRLVDGTDYTATNGSSITLTVGASTDDQIVVVSYATYQNADSYTKAEADSRYANVSGDTFDGGGSDPAQLTVKQNGNASGFIIKNYDGNEAQLVNVDNGPMVFKTNDDEKMRIDASGRVTMPYQPAFGGKNTTNNQISSGNVFKLNSMFCNVGNHYSTSTGRFTAPVAGQYLFSGTWMNQQPDSGNSYMFLRKNGVSEVTSYTTKYDTNCSISIILTLAVGDYVDPYIQAGSFYQHGNYHSYCGHLIG